jgi:hypothetical protein
MQAGFIESKTTAISLPQSFSAPPQANHTSIQMQPVARTAALPANVEEDSFIIVEEKKPEPPKVQAPPVKVEEKKPEPPKVQVPPVKVEEKKPEPPKVQAPPVKVEEKKPEPPKVQAPPVKVEEKKPEPPKVQAPPVKVAEKKPEPPKVQAPPVTTLQKPDEGNQTAQPAKPAITLQIKAPINVSDKKNEPFKPPVIKQGLNIQRDKISIKAPEKSIPAKNASETIVVIKPESGVHDKKDMPITKESIPPSQVKIPEKTQPAAAAPPVVPVPPVVSVGKTEAKVISKTDNVKIDQTAKAYLPPETKEKAEPVKSGQKAKPVQEKQVAEAEKKISESKAEPVKTDKPSSDKPSEPVRKMDPVKPEEKKQSKEVKKEAVVREQKPVPVREEKIPEKKPEPVFTAKMRETEQDEFSQDLPKPKSKMMFIIPVVILLILLVAAGLYVKNSSGNKQGKTDGSPAPEKTKVVAVAPSALPKPASPIPVKTDATVVVPPVEPSPVQEKTDFRIAGKTEVDKIILYDKSKKRTPIIISLQDIKKNDPEAEMFDQQIDPGSYTVKFIRDDYVDIKRDFELKAGNEVSITPEHLNWIKKPSLLVKTNLEANVAIYNKANGSNAGKGKTVKGKDGKYSIILENLDESKYKVVATRSGYYEETKDNVNLTNGKTGEVSISLKEIPPPPKEPAYKPPVYEQPYNPPPVYHPPVKPVDPITGH